jgi:hypothetical protein
MSTLPAHLRVAAESLARSLERVSVAREQHLPEGVDLLLSRLEEVLEEATSGMMHTLGCLWTRGILTPADMESGTDGPAYNAGRSEGHSDIAAALRHILDPDDVDELNLDGALARVRDLVRTAPSEPPRLSAECAELECDGNPDSCTTQPDCPSCCPADLEDVEAQEEDRRTYFDHARGLHVADAFLGAVAADAQARTEALLPAGDVTVDCPSCRAPVALDRTHCARCEVTP